MYPAMSPPTRMSAEVAAIKVLAAFSGMIVSDTSSLGSSSICATLKTVKERCIKISLLLVSLVKGQLLGENDGCAFFSFPHIRAFVDRLLECHPLRRGIAVFVARRP